MTYQLDQTMSNAEPLMTDPEPNFEAQRLTGAILRELALNPEGQPYDDSDPATWEEAEAAEPELVHTGEVRFKIVRDGTHEAALLGAFDADSEGEPSPVHLAWVIEMAPGCEMPAMGSYIALQDLEGGVPLVFYVWLTCADVDAIPEVEGAERSVVLDAIGPHQALLAQVLTTEEGEAFE